MDRRGCPPEFRRKTIDLFEEGRSDAQLAYDLETARIHPGGMRSQQLDCTKPGTDQSPLNRARDNIRTCR